MVAAENVEASNVFTPSCYTEVADVIGLGTLDAPKELT